VPGRRRDNRGATPYPRLLRVNQVLRQVVAEELERLSDADERLRLVTVTGVDTTPDLRHATIYVSSLSDEAAEGLAERRAQLQRAVNRQTHMKRTPMLAFEVDPAVVAGGRVEEVLRRIRGADAARGPVQHPEGTDPDAGADAGEDAARGSVQHPEDSGEGTGGATGEGIVADPAGER
jgi:ribosome-binding factor A